MGEFPPVAKLFERLLLLGLKNHENQF